MSSINSRLKWMEVFQADKKQKQILSMIAEPVFELENLQEIETKFNEFCEKEKQPTFVPKINPIVSSINNSTFVEEIHIKKRENSTRFATQRKMQVDFTNKSTTERSKFIFQTIDSNKSTNKSNKLNNHNNVSKKSSSSNSLSLLVDTKQQNPSKGVLKTSQLPSMLEISPKNAFTSNKSALVSNNDYQLGVQTPKNIISAGNFPTAATLTSDNKLQLKKPVKKQLTFKMDPHENKNENVPIKGSEIRKSQGNVRFSVTKNSSALLAAKQFQTQKSKQEDDSDIEERISQSAEWKFIQKKLKAQLKEKKPDSEDGAILNRIVKLFGNNFIAMVMQALVVKKIDDIYGVKINTESNVPISENLLKSFGISTQLLSQMSNASQKKEYIADTMAMRIGLMVKEWDEKNNMRNRRIEEDIRLSKNDQRRKREIQSDMFEWLKIGENHDQLKKKLRMTIIEKLTDFENQEEIQRKMGKRGSLPSADASQGPIHLKNLPYLSTKILLLRMNEAENKYLIEDLTKEQLEQYRETPHKDYLEENRKAAAGHLQEIGQLGSDSQQQLPEWTEELEKEFIQNKKFARAIYSQDITVSSWSKQGYLPLVQEYNLTNKKKMERDQLIENYRNGQWMTEKELKFIADTSQLLNQCINKEYVQKIVQNISKNDISRLELGLAESIINNYENMQRLIREQRLKYLQQRQADLIAKREKARAAMIFQNQRQMDQKRAKRYVKMFKTIGDRLLSNRFAYTFEVFKKNFFCKLFFVKMRDVVLKIRKKYQSQNLSEADAIKERHQKLLFRQKEFVTNMSQPPSKSLKGFIKSHDFHPPSKVPYIPYSEDFIVDKNRLEVMKYMVGKYQLTTRSKPQVRIQKNFQKFYTGGPPQENDTRLIKASNLLELSKKQFAGIIRMQTIFRQLRMKKLISQLKETDFLRKSHHYREKLQSYMNGRRFIKALTKGSGIDLLKKSENMKRIEDDDDDAQLKESSGFSEDLYSSSDEEGYYKEKVPRYLETQTKHQQQLLQANQQKQNNEYYATPMKRQEVKGQYHLNGTYRQVTASSTERNKTEELQNTQGSSPRNDRLDTKCDELSQGEVVVDGQGVSAVKTDKGYLEEKDQQQPQDEQKQQQQQQQLDQAPSQFKKADKALMSDSNTNSNAKKVIPNNKDKKGCSNILHRSKEQLGIVQHRQYTPKLLMKQQKLLGSAKGNRFLQIKNSGFNITEEDVNCVDKYGNTALYYVIQHQNIVFVRWLLSKQADINAVCQNKDTPVHQAFKSNNEEIIHDILCIKPNLNQVNSEGLTPLAYAPMSTLKKFNLQMAIVQKTDVDTNEGEISSLNNNELMKQNKTALKVIGKLRINNFFPIKSPTIQPQNYMSL